MKMKISPSLRKYIISEPVKVSSQELKKLDNILRELAGDEIGVEEWTRDRLTNQRALCTYPLLNPEFLSISDNLVYSDDIVKVPKFSIYSLYGSNMNLKFKKGDRYDSHNLYIGLPSCLPEVLMEQVFKSTDFSGEKWDKYYSSNTERIIKKASKPLKKKYNRVSPVEINRTFQEIVPKRIKKQIADAKKIFSGDIFIVEEEKPEDHEALVVPYQLLMGVHGNDCFYITEFKAEPLRKYAIKELIR